MKYILWALINSGVHAGYMGEFDSLAACQHAIQKRYELGISPLALQQPAVREAIRATLQYQQEYVCVPQK
jgi:hypothetical protein